MEDRFRVKSRPKASLCPNISCDLLVPRARAMNHAAVEHLEKQMHRTDARMDELALQVGDIQKNIAADENGDVEVDRLLRSVSEVRGNYQHLRKEISEVQDLQRQLSSSLQLQIRAMQSKFAHLKEKIRAQARPAAATEGGGLDRRSPQCQRVQHVNCVSDLSLNSLNDDGGFGAYLSQQHAPAVQPVPNLLMDVPEVPPEQRHRHC